ncbi:MAG: trypsin-like peptidase domain-containing protein [Aureliella sp.]
MCTTTKRQSARWLAFLFLALGLSGPNCQAADLVKQAQQQRIDVMKRAAQATVAVFGPDGGGGGSGVLITPDGLALTNYHVTSACGDFMRCGLNDGKVYDAVIVGIDATGDVSLIKLLGRDDFPTAPLADSSKVRVGQWCFAAGNPFVLATNLQPSISLGIVSGTGRYQYPAGSLLEYADCIQTDAAINPGNSGGPLFNLAGEIIGVNGRCSFEKRGRVNVGVGYAISANQLKYFVGMLASGRLVDHATLGATVSTSEKGRVLVSNILATSDAYRRGLRYGDEVVSLADREVRTTNGLKNILGTLPKEWRVPIVVRRDGDLQELLVRLQGVHTERQLIELVSAGIGGEPTEPEEDGEESEDAPASDNDPTNEADADQNVTKPQQFYIAREGFANYYFNDRKVAQIWQRTRQLNQAQPLRRPFQLTGKLGGENTQFKLDVGEEKAQLQVGLRSINLDLDQSPSEVIHKRGEASLLLALHAVLQYVEQGPRKIGSTTYLGKLPVYRSSDMSLAKQPLLDTTETLWYDGMLRLHFDSVGRIALAEVFGDASDDPAEVYLSYSEGEPNTISQIRLQFGTSPFLLLTADEASQSESGADK